MQEGFFVRAARVSYLAGAFDRQQETPSRLAGRLDGASAVDTGDPGLDGAIREELGQLTSLLRAFGQALGHDAAELRNDASGYQSADQQVAGDLDGVGASLPDGGIAGKLE